MKTVYVEKTDFEALERWRKGAFVKYLLKLKRAEATEHFILCLKQGKSDNLAWALLNEVYGEWRVTPELLPTFINETLNALEFATGAKEI